MSCRLLNVGVCFLLMIGAAAQAQEAPADVARRRHAVERGLLPYVPVVGDSAWSIEERMRLYGVPGMTIAVIRNHRVDWIKGYGLADTVRRIPATAATLYSAGSVSKMVAAMMALTLAQRGAIDLDAPVNTYLRQWKLGENERTKARPVTMRLLLAHRAGTSQSSYFGFTPRAGGYPSVVDILSGVPAAGSRAVVVNQPIGEGFAYSGGGYLVAQLAMMDATRREFAPLADSLLFRPLGLSSTTFQQPLPTRFASRAAWAYATNSWFKGMPYVYPQQAAAGLYTTAGDLARIVIEVQEALRGRGKVLSKASAEAMLTPQTEVSRGTYRERIGLGAFLLQRDDLSGDSTLYFTHVGVNAGFVAYAIGSVRDGNGAVIMMNEGGAGELGKEMQRAIARVYGWPGFLPPPIIPVAATPQQLDDVVGRYRRGPDEVISFARRGTRLIERIDAGIDVGMPIVAVPIGRDSIAFTDYPGTGVLVRDSSGTVTGIRMPFTQAPFPRLRDDELLPGELLRAGRLAEARAAYRALKFDEWRITSMIYELLNRRPFNPARLPLAEALLEVAEEQFPASVPVMARRGDWYARRGERDRALASYRAALKLAPDDATLREAIAEVEKNGKE